MSELLELPPGQQIFLAFRLAQSLTEYRDQRATEITPFHNRKDPENTSIALVFQSLLRYRKGQRDQARDYLDQAHQYVEQMLPSPSGPDYEQCDRAHGWAVAQVLLAEAYRVVEVSGKQFDHEVARTLAAVRRDLKDRLGTRTTNEIMFAVGEALVTNYAEDTDNQDATEN